MVDFDYYRDIYYGDAVGNYREFMRLKNRAYGIIKKCTANRVERVNVGDKEVKLIKNAICRLVDELHAEGELASRVGLKSESIGDFSRSYDSHTSSSRIDNDIIYSNIVTEELAGTWLISAIPIGRYRR